MAKLVKNVGVDGVMYGPDYIDPPPDVAARIGAHAWDEPDDRVSVDLPAVPPVDGGGGDDDEHGSPAADPDPPATDSLDGLDLPALRKWATDEGVKFDRRWKEPRLRAEIRAAANETG